MPSGAVGTSDAVAVSGGGADDVVDGGALVSRRLRSEQSQVH
jgi:hypothetical protein